MRRMRRIESKGFATSHPADEQPATKGTTMNRSFEIVTDSCCNLTEETIDRYELHVLPLTFMADGDDTVYRSYLKGEKTAPRFPTLPIPRSCSAACSIKEGTSCT